MEQLSSLAGLDLGQGGRVASVEAEGAMRRRLLDLGLIPGHAGDLRGPQPGRGTRRPISSGDGHRPAAAGRRRGWPGAAACPEAVCGPRPAREGV